MSTSFSIATQTMYADLTERAWRGHLEDLMGGAGGSAYKRTVNGRDYWYWQPPSVGGKQPTARYIGPDTPEARERIAALKERKVSRKERREMVRALVAAGLARPDRRTGDVLAALAEAGVFRLRAAVVGSIAFQCYPALLGCSIPASLAYTGDVDLAQFHAISLAVEDRVEESFEAILQRADPRFRAIPDPMDSRRTLRYSLITDGEETYSVDVLSPLRGPERGRTTRLEALDTDAQLLRFLDFLLYQEQNAVVLHGPGIPVNVPSPERYACHKLLVAQLRRDIPRSQIKARKDLDQAQALLEILLEDRPEDLADIWQELRERGDSWRKKADRSLAQLPEDLQNRMAGLNAS